MSSPLQYNAVTHNTFMKLTTRNVRETVRNDLLEHDHRHRIFFSPSLSCFGYTPLCWKLSYLCPRSVTSCIGRDSFLHHSPNAVITRIKVRTAGRTQWRAGAVNSGVSRRSSSSCSTCTMSRCVVLLKDVNFISDESGGRQ